MTRLHPKALRFKGGITVFASLVFLLLLSLIAALLTSSNVQMRKSTMRAKAAVALENVFAEYHRDLLDQYDIFARADAQEEKIVSKLQYYGVTNADIILTKYDRLTDQQGLPFYHSALRYMKNLYGMDTSIGGGNLSPFKSEDTTTSIGLEVSEHLTELLSQDEGSLLEEGNPLGTIQNLKKSSLLSILVSNEENISHRSIDTTNVVSKRDLEQGRGSFADTEGEGGIAEKYLFVEYLFSHFGDASEERNLNALSYELEYILCGESMDSDNLEKVLEKILLIRMGINYAYLLTDEEKQVEAGILATGLCVLMTVPGITEAVKQALLLAWAYGESIVDLRVLMKQQKVPLFKTAETWQLRLANLGKLGSEGEMSGEKPAENGLSYTDYLKGFLLLEQRESLCMRSLDLIEKNLSVPVDQCMTRAQVETTHVLWKNLSDRFLTEYQYQ